MSTAALTAVLAAATGSAAVDRVDRVSGGCINDCYAVIRGSERYFVKLNDAQASDAFAAEADGLRALHDAGLRVPAVVAEGVAGDHAYLVLEHLALGRGSTAGYRELGRRLASLHAQTQPRFGWHRDNYIGATPQRNDRGDDWTAFWIERRLAPQLALAAARGHRLDGNLLCDSAARLLEGHALRPALLHGDLWGGNAAFLADGTPVVFDPAVYCGDAEADLAMTELFGGFPTAFYDGYREVRPIDDSYRERRDLYNLYHVMNHLNLFGGGYLAQAQAMIERVAAAAR